MSRPLIGVTGPDYGGRAAWWAARFALWRAGARAVRIQPSRPVAASELDGLIVGGGADVDPTLYRGAETSLAEVMEEGKEESSDGEVQRARWLAPFLYLFRRIFGTSRYTGLDSARDQLELSLMNEMLASGRPVLGICRGAQLLNVSHGGTLFEDLDDFYVESPNPWTVLPKKSVSVEDDTRLRQFLGAERLRVNALHKQAIKDVAPGLRAVAHEDNGVIQAVEADRGFAIGVQWHPEYMPQSPRQRALFRGLVAAAKPV